MPTPCNGTFLVKESIMFALGVAASACAFVNFTASIGAYPGICLDAKVASYGPSWWYSPPPRNDPSRESIVSVGTPLRRCRDLLALLCSSLIFSSGDMKGSEEIERLWTGRAL